MHLMGFHYLTKIPPTEYFPTLADDITLVHHATTRSGHLRSDMRQRGRYALRG